MGQVKVRESNIELLRNISMFMILVIHANFVALPKISYEELMSNATPSIVRFFIESVGIVAVNVFVFISGWFGVRPRTKSVLSFIYQILFFLVGGGIFFILIGQTEFNVKEFLNILQLTPKDWFIKSYFVLMIIAPILNAYTKNADEKTQRYVMIAFFFFEAIYGWAAGGRRFFVNGYGPLHFIGLYITAQYIHHQLKSETTPMWMKKIFQLPKWVDLLVFGILVAANTALVTFGTILLHNSKTIFNITYAYSNPLVILGALYLLLFFSKMKIPYNRTINRFGASSFAVYLFHGETTVRNHFFCPQIQSIYESYSGLGCIGLVFLYLCVVYIISVLIDQLRLLSWNKICLRVDNRRNILEK